MFANKEKIENHRTVSTFAICMSRSKNRKLQKSYFLPTLGDKTKQKGNFRN